MHESHTNYIKVTPQANQGVRIAYLSMQMHRIHAGRVEKEKKKN